MAADGRSAKGEIADLSFPLSFVATLGQQQDVVDDGRDWDGAAQLKHAGHAFAAGHPTLSIRGHRTDVMRDQHAILRRCPSQQGRVIDTRQADILHSDDVEIGLSAE